MQAGGKDTRKYFLLWKHLGSCKDISVWTEPLVFPDQSEQDHWMCEAVWTCAGGHSWQRTNSAAFLPPFSPCPRRHGLHWFLAACPLLLSISSRVTSRIYDLREEREVALHVKWRQGLFSSECFCASSPKFQPSLAVLTLPTFLSYLN